MPILIRLIQGEPPLGTKTGEMVYNLLNAFAYAPGFWLMTMYSVMPVLWGYGQLKMTWGILNLVNGHGSSGGIAWRRYVDQANEGKTILPCIDLRKVTNVSGWATLLSVLHGSNWSPVTSRKFQIYGIISMFVFLLTAGAQALGSWVNTTLGEGTDMPLEVKLVSIARLLLLSLPIAVQVMVMFSINRQ
ncbi:hypothetical protein T484DRAFT_3094524 [Baffinella frigidus]|nr:hypothetical protein T484DRAFT_3094524 [Cryptophyta sp. CCMP2293]